MTTKTNPLAVMDSAIESERVRAESIGGRAWINQMSADSLKEARAAVAELVEAQRKAHDAMLLADWNVQALCSPRQHSAYLASAAALAAFEVAP